MKKRHSQIAMEYIVITGVAFMILIPGMYFFRNYVASSNERIIEQRINQVANEILNTGVGRFLGVDYAADAPGINGAVIVEF